jgi:hypothetical protein
VNRSGGRNDEQLYDLALLAGHSQEAARTMASGLGLPLTKLDAE